MDWLVSGDDLWEEMFNDLSNVDTMLMGRKMSQEYADYWRAQLTDTTADPNLRKFARIAEQTQHVVFSTTLTTFNWENTRIATDVETEVKKLKAQSGGTIVAWGGATLVSSLLKLKLVDELSLTISPVILGGGRSMFQQNNRYNLKLINSRKFSSGGVLVRYKL